jgi:hypothetical protein
VLVVGALAAALAAAAVLAAYDLASYLALVVFAPKTSDFYLYYLAAQVGRAQGWVHMYDPTVYLPLLTATSGRYMPFLNPPFLAWLVTPLSFLPYQLALPLWSALIAACLVITWWLASPGRGLIRWIYLLAAVGLYPVILAAMLGQTTLLVAAAVAVAWWLLRHGRPLLAGVALAVLTIKPQTAFLVPLALLVAGYWRTFLSCGLVSLALALISFFAVGPAALQYYRDDLAIVQTLPGLQVPTLIGVLPPAAWAFAAAALAALVALTIAWLTRGDGPEVPIAAGLLGSMLAAPYLQLTDLTLLVLGAWLVLRTQPPPWHRVLLLVGYISLEFAFGRDVQAVVTFNCLWLAALLALAAGRRLAHALRLGSPAPGRLTRGLG